VYVPESLWPEYKKRLLEEIAEIKVGDVCDFSNFVNAVIDANAFRTISGFIDEAKNDSTYEILIGGKCDDSKGYFIEPTVVVSKDPKSKLMREEIFGPVVTVYVYPDNEYEETLRLCDQTSVYALTGAIFGRDRQAVVTAMTILRQAAGNFYVNDKPTGAIVGQQPFGGSRASGTNDKAGSVVNLLRWVSPRAIKETLLPAENWRYPFLG
jgi:1-pyrroline-5-carboxylate dehydrogenase